MSTLQNAADELKRFAVRFQAVLVLADELERIGSIDNAANEAENRIVLAKQREAEVNAAIEVAKASLGDVRAEADSVVSAASADAAATLSAAEESAVALKTKATSEAERIVSTAQDQRASVQVEIDTASESLATLNKQIDAAQAELGKINSVISEARAKIGV